jgi:hypothetical protein
LWLQAAAFVEQQRLGLASQAEFHLDASALSKRKATTAAITAWPDDDHSDDDFDVDAATQVPCMAAFLSPTAKSSPCLIDAARGEPCKLYQGRKTSRSASQ